MSETFKVRVPQMGEGLQFATVVRILKQAGEWAEEDADVVEVETEKAILSISTPVAGIVAGVACRPGDKVNVDAVLLEIEQAAAQAARPAQTRKGDMAAPSMPRPGAKAGLPGPQLDLIRRMRESRDIVVPASMDFSIDWGSIDAVKRACRSRAPTPVPSATAIIVWAVARAMQAHEKFRARLTPDNDFHVSPESRIGIAAAGDDDTLDIPVVSVAAQESWRAVQEKTRRVLNGADANGGYHSVALSDMSALQVMRAQPIVVYPAVATLFIGAPGRGTGDSRFSTFVLTFDHRVMNGAYAAKFLKYVGAGIRLLADEMSKTERTGEHATPLAKFGT